MRFALSGFIALVALAVAPVADAANNILTGNYRIDAIAEPGAEPIWDGAKVVIRDAAGTVVARRHSVPTIVDLPRQDGYTATVIYKQSAGRAELSPGTTQVNLRAGEATLQLVAAEGGGPAVTAQQWEVFRYAPGRSRGTLIARSKDASPLLTLSAGWYEVEAEHAGGGATLHVIEVQAGRRFDYRIVADAS